MSAIYDFSYPHKYSQIRKYSLKHYKWRTFGRFAYYRPGHNPPRYTMREYNLDPNGVNHLVQLSDYSKISLGTPFYKEIINSGGHLPENNYLETRVWDHYPIATFKKCYHYFNGIGDHCDLDLTYDDFPSLLGLPSNFSEGYPPSADIQSVLRQKLISKISDNRANLGEFVGEFHQTQRLFQNTVRRVLYGAELIAGRKFGAASRWFNISRSRSRVTTVNSVSIDDLVKMTINRGKPLSKSKVLANTWLEFIYGWQPLLNDIFGTVTALADRLPSSDIPHPIIKTVRKQMSLPVESLLSLSPGGSSNHSGVSTVRGTTLYRIQVSYRVTNDDSFLRNQLGLQNPLSIAWNLLPYSFVVDWFYRVGDLIDTYTATSGLAFISGSETYIRTVKGTAHVEFGINQNLDDGRLQLVGNILCDTTQRQHIRNSLSDFPQPNLNRGTGLTRLHTANLLALLRGRFK
jgi:hypothetical protein